MAFRRRRIKNSIGEFLTEPVTCSICKEKNAFTTLHGHYDYGGKTCCNECFIDIKQKVDIKNSKGFDTQSEAEYSIEQRWLK